MNKIISFIIIIFAIQSTLFVIIMFHIHQQLIIMSNSELIILLIVLNLTKMWLQQRQKPNQLTKQWHYHYTNETLLTLSYIHTRTVTLRRHWQSYFFLLISLTKKLFHYQIHPFCIQLTILYRIRNISCMHNSIKSQLFMST